MLGASEATLRPGQVNVLWHLSHPDVATPGFWRIVFFFFFFFLWPRLSCVLLSCRCSGCLPPGSPSSSAFPRSSDYWLSLPDEQLLREVFDPDSQLSMAEAMRIPWPRERLRKMWLRVLHR